MEKYYAKLVTLNAGYPHDKLQVKKNLILGNTYVIEDMYISAWYTDVYLEGFSGGFNSVFFEFYNENGEEVDFLSIPFATRAYEED